MPTHITAQVVRARAEVLSRTDTDPILNFNHMAADASVSLATFKREMLPHLPVVALTEHRRGVRRSDWLDFLASRTRSPGQRAASSIDEFCERNSVSRSKAYAEINAGRLKSRKVGPRRLITPEAEEAWLASLDNPQAAA